VSRKRGGPRRTYRVEYTLEAERGWSVTIPGKPGGVNCVSQGRSILQARAMIRDALRLCLDDDAAGNAAVFVEEFILPRRVGQRVDRAHRLRLAVESAQAKATEAMRVVAADLGRSGMSQRDIGEVLGVPLRTVRQLVGGDASTSTVSTRRN